MYLEQVIKIIIIGTIILLLSGSGAEKYKCLVPGVSFDLYLSHMLSKTVVSALS